MRYRLQITEEALRQLRALPGDVRCSVGQRLNLLQYDLHGDVRKLAGTSGHYRARSGSMRILFTLEKDLITVHAVKDRKDACRG